MTVGLEAERGRLVLFLVLHVLGGHIGMPLILFTIFVSQHVVRWPVFTNFCITWIFFSSSYVMLLYAGQIDNLYPAFPLCLAQAAMVYAGAAMIGVSSFIFMLHLFLVVRSVVHEKQPLRWDKLRLAAMLTVPYLVYLVMFTAAIISGYSRPQLVHRSSFYCTLKITTITHLGTGIAGGGLLFSCVIEILTIRTLYCHWKTILKTGTKSGLNLSLVIRALVFTVWGIVALLTCAAILTHSLTAVSNIIIACLPVIAVLIFLSQKDLLRVWCLWRNERKAEHGPHPISPSTSSSFVDV